MELSGLNPQQYRAVTSFHGPTLILAGAGTGKTRVITYRIAHMLQSGVDADKITAVTFTNKAANEMRERIVELVGRRAAKPLKIGTFHSFGLNILKRFSSLAGLNPHFSLAGTADQIDFVRRSLADRGWTSIYNAHELHAQISFAKNKLLTPKDLASCEGIVGGLTQDPQMLAVVFDLYERQLNLNQAIDFDDCIFKTVHLLENESQLRQNLIQENQFILVDEFQDTNYGQLRILETLAKDHSNICAVGDDDQSIYSWRGAMYETLERFERIFKGTQLIKLEQNYRSTGIILNSANVLIRHNSQRKDKTLWSENKGQTPIVLAGCVDERAEARFIAEKCLAHFGRDGLASDIAVIYRANTQAKIIEQVFREYQIPYRTFGGQSFFERKEIKDFLAYLRLIVKPQDHMALWRTINTPPRGIGVKTLEKLAEFSRQNQQYPFETLSDPAFSSSSRVHEVLQVFSSKIRSIMHSEKKTPNDLLAIGEKILNEFKLESDIKQRITSPVARQNKIENLKGLPSWLKGVAESYLEEQGTLDFVELVERLTLQDGPDLGQNNDRTEAVSLMTIHASKGLEFPMVFVSGIEEDLLPHKNSVEAGSKEIQEERRLFYVALTRAKQHLYLSLCASRSTGFQRTKRKPSRFIAELPKENMLVEKGLTEGEERQAQNERKQATVSRLSALRNHLQKNLSG